MSTIIFRQEEITMKNISKEAVSVPEMLSIRQVVKRGILSERAIRDLVADGRIKTVKSGKVHYINYGLLLAQLNSEDSKIWDVEKQPEPRIENFGIIEDEELDPSPPGAI
jgi:hypothetical protein